MVEKLSVDQVSLCQYRHMMLFYLDRLETYQVIVDQVNDANTLFEWRTYGNFRSENLVTSAINYARDSDWKALVALFTYHGDVILPHRLAILSNFPETTPPNRYASLLPVVSSEGQLVKWAQKDHRAQDWVESEVTRKLCSLPDDRRASYGDFIYDGNSQWMQYLRADSMEVVRTWYMNRAAEIEEFSGQVDSALALVELSCDNGVMGMADVLHELKTLHTLVYECGADSRLSWKKLKSLSDLEIIQLKMKETEVSESDFVQGMETRVLPFLNRLEAMAVHRSRGLMKDYLKLFSKTDLTPCLMILRQSNEVLDGTVEDSDDSNGGVCRQPLICLARDRMDIAITCIHACERSDQLGVANQIIECLPTRESDSTSSSDLHDLVDALENYISAAGTLKQYNILKPVRYIKSVQENPDEARQLLVMLTRVASRRTPAMTESGWRTLLHHLLSLRRTIFSFIDVVTCYKIYTESLLCSGVDSNIQLAVRHLSLHPSSSSSGSSSPSQLATEWTGEEEAGEDVVTDFKLSYAVSVDLVVGAAKEYFNSAANLMDDDMDLARSCLCLFPYPGPRVQAELDLIASLALLDDFQLSMLPVQVRLCENKLDIVRNILDATPSAYKKHDKIVRLCRLLESKDSEETESVDSGELGAGHRGPGIGGDQGHALIIIILSALEKRDYRMALELSSQLMTAQFPPAWEVCRMMGLNLQLGDIETRKKLLDFSITHCPPEEIVSLLQSKKLLHLQSQLSRCGITERTGAGTASRTPSSGREGRGVAGEGDGGGRGLVGKSVQLVSLGAGAVQSWMKPGTTSSIPTTSLWSGDVDKEVEHVVLGGVVKLREHVSWLEERRRSLGAHSMIPHNCCHPFYPVPSNRQARQYGRGKGQEIHERQVLSLQVLLHFSQVALDLSIKDQRIMTDCTEVSLKLAELLCDKDIHLVVGHLLDIHKGEELEAWLSRVSPSQFSLELVLYCVALQLYIITTSSSGFKSQDTTPSDIYQATPATFLSHVTSSVKSCDLQGRWSEEQKPWVFLLEKYQQMLADHNQAVTLLNLGLGIDVDQFAEDEEYRRSIITSLARSSDAKIFSTALSQAHCHGVDLWEVHMSLLESLLTTSSSGIEDIERKLKERQVLPSILRAPQKSLDYLTDTVYPQLSGKKLARLLLYYTVLQQCVDHGAHILGRADIDVDIQVLTKLKRANVQEVDYKVLMSCEGDSLLQLLPSLSSSNVHTVADIARHIPYGQGAVLTSGMVLCAFALNLFWNGQKATSKSSAKDSLKKLEQCKEYLSLLSPAQFQYFVLGIAVSKKSLQLSVDVRCQLIKTCIHFCQDHILHETSSGSKKDKNMSQEELMVLLDKYLTHLTNLKGELTEKDGNLSEETWKKFKREFDLSLCETDKVCGLVRELIKCGASPECVENILKHARKVNPDQPATPVQYKEALQQVLKAAIHSYQDSGPDGRDSGPGGSPTEGQDSDSVRMIFSAVSQHETGGGSLVASKDLISIMTPFCKDKSNPLHLRKLWFTLIEQHLFLSEEDHHLLLYHHTQSLLEDVFPNEVNMADISSAAGQRKLFTDLLGSCETDQQMQTLCSLLECWSEAGSSLLIDCWVDLLKFLAARPGQDSFQQVLFVRAGLSGILAEVDEELVSRAESSVSALKYSLLCEGNLFDASILKEKEIVLPAEVDRDLMELLLYKKKVLQLRTSQHPLYRHLYEYVQDPSSGPAQRELFAKLLCCLDSEVDEKLCVLDRSKRVKEFAEQLYNGGFTVEAGALLVSAVGFHRELATVTDSLAYIKSLFSK